MATRTYNVLFTTTMSYDVEASNREEAIEKARERLADDLASPDNWLRDHGSWEVAGVDGTDEGRELNAQ